MYRVSEYLGTCMQMVGEASLSAHICTCSEIHVRFGNLSGRIQASGTRQRVFYEVVRNYPVAHITIHLKMLPSRSEIVVDENHIAQLYPNGCRGSISSND